MKKFFIFSAFFAASLLCAEVIEFKTKADFTRGNILNGPNFLRTFVPGVHVEGKKFAVDTAKTYRLSGEFRAGKNSKGKIEHIYFGFVPFDANGRQIVPEAVRPINTGIFSLAADAKAGDKVLKIKCSFPKIINSSYVVVAFDAKNTSLDIPNYNLSPRLKHKTLKYDNGIITVELMGAMKFARPAGTPIRFHSLDVMHIYACGRITPTDKWQKFSGEVSGRVVHGVPAKKWWNGTASASPIFRYVGKTVNCELEFRNIRVEVIEKK